MVFLLAVCILGCKGEAIPKSAPLMTGINVTPSSVALVLDGEPGWQQLQAEAVPETVTGVAFNWSSSNPSIASVSQSGLVTATGVGATNVMVMSGDYYQRVPVTVTGNEEPPDETKMTGINVSPASVVLALGSGAPATQQLTAQPAPSSIPDVEFTWSSDDPSVATVSQTGLVTATGFGATNITVASGEFSQTVPVTASGKELTIGIWVTPQTHLLDNISERRRIFKQVADAGINLAWGGGWEYSFIRGDALTPSVLDICAEYGINFLLHAAVDIRGNSDPDAELTRILNQVEAYKHHPAVHGFMMGDEPSATAFDRMARVRREVEAVLPEGKYMYTNLYPNYASASALGSPNYQTHVEDFMQKVQTKVLSFDHYPLANSTDTENRRARDRGFVSNLVTIRNASIKFDVPFWGFIQAIGWNGMREPTFDEYRWQCNAHLVFGAKGFSYFLYAQRYADGGGEGFTGAMLDWNGATTYLYDYAKNINQELSGFSRMVMPFTNDGVILVNQHAQMVATVPANLQKTLYGNLSKIETTGEMLNGCFDLNGKKAVYLFNWSKDAPMSAKLELNGQVYFQLWGKDGLEMEQTASELNVTFMPGEAKFLIF